MTHLIVITPPGRVDNEREICRELFRAGLNCLHVRKNNWNEEELLDWLSFFNDDELLKLKIHRHTTVFEKLNLGGLHLSYSNDFSYLKNNNQTFSSSVHSWEEAETALHYSDYVLISPVYNSISKNGYLQNNELQHIPGKLKTKKIIALGGINSGNISEVEEMGYYGAAVLGYIWNEPEKAIANFKKLKKV